MCFAEGASFRTAETVPAERPTWAATDFSVTMLPLGPSVFFFSAIVPIVQDEIRAGSRSRRKATHYIAKLEFKMPEGLRLNPTASHADPPTKADNWRSLW